MAVSAHARRCQGNRLVHGSLQRFSSGLLAAANMFVIASCARCAWAEVTLSEVLVHLEAVEAAYSAVDMDGERTHTRNVRADPQSKEGKPSKLRVRWVQLRDRIKREGHRGNIKTICVAHPEVSFAGAQEEPIQEPQIYLLSSAPGEHYERQKNALKLDLDLCRAAYWLEVESVRELLTRGKLQDIRITKGAAADGDVIIEGTLRNVDGVMGEVQCKIKITLGAELGFAIRRFEWLMKGVKGNLIARKSRTVEYAPREGTVVFDRVVEEIERFASKSLERYEYKVTSVSFEPPSESEFTLEGCGFGSVIVKPPGWGRTAISVAALIVAAVSLVLILRFRRRGGEPTSS